MNIYVYSGIYVNIFSIYFQNIYIYSGLKQIVGDPGRVNQASWRNEEEEVHEIGWCPILECQYGRNKRAVPSNSSKLSHFWGRHGDLQRTSFGLDGHKCSTKRIFFTCFYRL